jgi:hypothetical protein
MQKKPSSPRVASVSFVYSISIEQPNQQANKQKKIPHDISPAFKIRIHSLLRSYLSRKSYNPQGCTTLVPCSR